MRVEFRGEGPRFPEDPAGVQEAFAPIVERFQMEARLSDRPAKPRFVIAVSQGSHCLHHLLHLWLTGTLASAVARVVSNREAQRCLSEWTTTYERRDGKACVCTIRAR